MRRLLKIGGWVFVVLVLISGVMAGLAMMVDWNSFKPQIEDQLSAKLGRQVRIAGDLSGQFWPDIQMTVKDVRVLNVPGAKNRMMVEVGSAQLDLALMPLFSKQIDVRQIVIHQPVVHLEKLSNGQVNWEFDKKETKKETDEKSGDVAKSGDDQKQVSLSLDRVVIDGAMVDYYDHSTRETQTVQNMRLAVASLSQGQYKADGTLQYNTAQVRFDVERFDPISRQTFPVNLVVEDGFGKITANGSVQVQPDLLMLVDVHTAIKGQKDGMKDLLAQSQVKVMATGLDASKFNVSAEIRDLVYGGKKYENVTMQSTISKVTGQKWPVSMAAQLLTRGVTQDEFEFENVNVALHSSGSWLEVDELDAEFLNGNIKAKGKMPLGDTAGAQFFTVDVAGLDMAELMVLLKKPDHVRGLLDVKAQMQILPADQQKPFVEAARGHADFSLRSGKLIGLDLPAISAQLKKLDDVNAFLQLMDMVTAKGETDFDQFTGRLSFQDGVGTTNNTKLVSKVVHADVAGSVNMKQRNMDLAARVKLLEHPQAPAFDLRAQGDLSAPQYRMEATALQNYLFQKGVTSVINKLLKKKHEAGDKSGVSIQDFAPLLQKLPNLGQ